MDLFYLGEYVLSGESCFSSMLLCYLKYSRASFFPFVFFDFMPNLGGDGFCTQLLSSIALKKNSCYKFIDRFFGFVQIPLGMIIFCFLTLIGHCSLSFCWLAKLPMNLQYSTILISPLCIKRRVNTCVCFESISL